MQLLPPRLRLVVSHSGVRLPLVPGGRRHQNGGAGVAEDDFALAGIAGREACRRNGRESMPII